MAQPTICRICKENCGILVKSAGSKLEIAGNPAHPVSKGFICFRGRHFAEVHRSPKRLRRPLLRRGSVWEEISYERALDHIASRLLALREKYGAQSVVFHKGESLKHQEVALYMRHLARGFGSPNYISVSSLCHHGMVLAHTLTYGGVPAPNFERMKVAIVWGANPLVSHPRMSVDLKRALKNGTKLVVVDPSHTQTAELADLHLRVTPGADGFLALAFIKRAVEKGLMNGRTPFPNGREALESLVLGLSYRGLLEKAGVPEERFFKACSLIFEGLPGWIQTGLGLELQPHGVQTIRAIAFLQSILDPDNQPAPMSAGLVPLPGEDRYPEAPDPIGRREVPVFTDRLKEGQGMWLSRAILADDPYPVRAMLVVGANPLLTFPDSRLHARAFQKLDFLAVFDLFMTQTARMADLVFPAADFLECSELHDYGASSRPYLGLVQPVASDGAGRPIWEFIFELARRLGLANLFPWSDNGEAISYRLSGSGVSLDELMDSPSSTVAYEPSTPIRDLRDASNGVNYRSVLLEKAGYPGMPFPDALTPPHTTSDGFPFRLSTGDKVSCFQHSQFREHPTHRSVMPEPVVDIHPAAALRLGIVEGDFVTLSTPNGKIGVRANLNPDVREDCLRLTHGWEDADANELTTSDHLDPISGFPWMRALPARVEKKGQ